VAAKLLLPGDRRGVIHHSEHRLEAGYLQDLPHRWTRPGEDEFSALFTYPAQSREQHVHSSGIAELDSSHVDHDMGLTLDRYCRRELAMQSRCRIQIYFS
jgi:hypothetical protein